jgi:hypothetical protein
MMLAERSSGTQTLVTDSEQAKTSENTPRKAGMTDGPLPRCCNTICYITRSSEGGIEQPLKGISLL